MSRERDVDWGDWTGAVQKPVAPQSRPVQKNCQQGGEKVTQEALRKEAMAIVKDAHSKNSPYRQPTDQELFGHLVQSQETIDIKNKTWNEILGKSLNDSRCPIDDIIKAKLPAHIKDQEWVSGTSFNDMLSPEEVKKRDKFVKE